MPNWPDTRDANLEVVDDGARLDVAPGDHGSDAGAIEEPVSSFGSDDGEPCESAEECASGACMPDPDWPEGYCTRRPCVADEECSAPDVVCSSFESERLCLLTCIGEGSCREGYWCAPSEDGDDRVCVPGQAPTPTGLADGEACASDEECSGGTCLEEPDWPGGYCTTLECSTFEDCARGAGEEYDNRCLIQQGGNFCVRICNSNAACRSEEGYICQPLSRGMGVCVPGEPSTAPPQEIDFDGYPFEVVCGLSAEGGRLAFDYRVGESTSAYMVVPLARDGAQVEPLRIELPDGDEIDLRGSNAFQLAPSSLFGFVNPVVVPVTPAFAGQLQAGDHRMVIETRSEDVCWYLLEESSSGTTIDLNVWLVGVEGVDAASAPSSPEFRELFDTFDEIYAQAGVQIGERRFIDASEEVSARYSIIRSQAEVEALVQTTVLPSPERDGALSLNVFFVRGFSFGGGSGAIGISMGLPGAAGLHGSRSSGVAFTTEFMGEAIPGEGDGDAYTGVVMAHEVGHYLGLFHTSEQFGAGFDPLGDTPECRRNFPAGCPDLDNLMFPLAGIAHREMSEDQAWQVRVNPLTKD